MDFKLKKTYQLRTLFKLGIRFIHQLKKESNYIKFLIIYFVNGSYYELHRLEINHLQIKIIFFIF